MKNRNETEMTVVEFEPLEGEQSLVFKVYYKPMEDMDEFDDPDSEMLDDMGELIEEMDVINLDDDLDDRGCWEHVLHKAVEEEIIVAYDFVGYKTAKFDAEGWYD